MLIKVTYRNLKVQIRSFTKYLLIAYLSLANTYHVFAKSTEWTNPSSSIWHNASNWSNGIPTTGDTAVIDVDNVTVTLDQNEAIEHLFIGSGSTLKINSLVTFSVTHTDLEAIIIFGTLENLGTINASNSLTGLDCVANRGTLQNLGSMNVQGGFVGIRLYTGSEFLNYGVCTIMNSDAGIVVQGSYSDDISSQLTISNCISNSLIGSQSSVSVSGTLSIVGNSFEDIDLAGSNFSIATTGNVVLTNCFLRCQVGATFINQGTMTMNGGSWKMEELSVSTSITSGGNLTINNAQDTALIIKKLMINDGTININNGISDGIYVGGTFTNNGNINITDQGKRGIVIDSNMINNTSINITDYSHTNTEYGIRVNQEGSFVTRGGVEIYGTGLYVFGYFGQFENGFLSSYDEGISLNGGTIENDASGIEVENGELYLQGNSEFLNVNGSSLILADSGIRLHQASVLDNFHMVTMTNTTFINMTLGGKLIVRNGGTFTSSSSVEKLDVEMYGELIVEGGGVFDLQ